MDKYLFFDAKMVSGNYDRVYNSEDFAEFFCDIISNGVVENEENQNSFMLSTTGGNIFVRKGKAYINGRKFVSDSTLAFTVPTVAKNKILAIIVSLNYTERNFTIFKKEFESVDKIELKRDMSNYELMVGYARLYPNVALSSINLIDTRKDKKYCGIAKARI